MSVEQAGSRFARVKFAEFLGVTIVEVARGRGVLALPLRPELINAGGRLSGGASASLLNITGTLTAWTELDVASEPHSGCVDMSVRYLAAATGDEVTAEAQILRRGHDLCFLHVALRSSSGTPICQGLMAYRAPDYGGHSPRLQARHQPVSAPAPLTPPEDPWLFRGYVKSLGIAPVYQSPGRVRLRMPCNPMHTDERGHLHPGALASLVDIAGVAAAWSLVPCRQGARGSTIGMHVSYTSATAEPVVADAQVQQRSEELFFSTITVTDANTEQLVAMGQLSYRLLEPRG
jgi:uncharacterized protein (TIGR00369 family)